MTRRTPAQVYQDLRQVGFGTSDAVTMTAIAGAESGYRNDAQGDLGLQTSVWGPSYGLYQIRTLRAQTGTGGDRDIRALATSDDRQAKAAYDISNGGRSFRPWTTFTSGKYKQFLSRAQAAAGGAAPSSGSSSSDSTTQVQTVGLTGDITSTLMDRIRDLMLPLAFGGAGMALVVLGLWRMTGMRQQVEQAAGVIAKAAI